jgi:hypothetical protein
LVGLGVNKILDLSFDGGENTLLAGDKGFTLLQQLLFISWFHELLKHFIFILRHAMLELHVALHFRCC